MSTVFQTVTETTTAVVSLDTTIGRATVTSHLSTTLVATFGQTVTILSPSIVPAQVEPPTAKYTPTTTADITTATLTEIDVYLQNSDGGVYSTWIIPLLPPPSTSTGGGDSNSLVYVVEPKSSDWDDWSQGKKAGLIVGVVLAAVLLFALIFYLSRRRKWGWWVAHGWPGSSPNNPSQLPAPTPGPSFVQPTIVNGPLMPYGHAQHAYGLPGARWG